MRVEERREKERWRREREGKEREVLVILLGVGIAGMQEAKGNMV